MIQQLEYSKLRDKCVRYLIERKYITLATSYQDQVRSRIVDYVNGGITIGFFTWDNTVKVEHIKHNPRVALAVDNLQIEGMAKIIGHPPLSDHASFMEIYQERLPSPYKNFTSLPNALWIIVEPTLLIMMKYEDQHLYSDYLDVIQQTAYRKELSPWNP